ncbi:MAG: bifunctional pyr operon transcriptional regulator/uracil phosphoribosyltransferase, partial [Burkholderiales bacterium]|nr:bifunctional pyr operon transcriptional regulator/uracil phosphoribosyltransferase [Burkholderiales bacterium]
MPPINAESLYQALLAQIRQAYGADLPALAGIHSGGAWLAERLARDLGAPAYGVVNAALHRDDYAKK